MSLPLLPGLSGLALHHQEVVPTNARWSDTRGEEGSADEEEAELHAPTKQEMLQYELMRMTLDPKYRPQHPDFDQALRYASEELKNDREVVLQVVKQDGGALRYASEELKNDREVVLAAVKQNGWALMYASEELKNDREVVLDVVKRAGYVLKYASEELKKDREVVLAAVKSDRQALQFASNELKKDPEMLK